MTNKISSCLPSARQSTLPWPAFLLTSVLVGSTLIACAVPLVAIATLAAATMTRRSAFLTLLLCWGASQVLGFSLHGYPQTLFTVGWGVAIGLGGVVALIVSQMILRPGQARLWIVQRSRAGPVPSRSMWSLRWRPMRPCGLQGLGWSMSDWGGSCQVKGRQRANLPNDRPSHCLSAAQCHRNCRGLGVRGPALWPFARM